MLYTVVFINKQELRDIKLEKILNSDFVEESYVHNSDFDYTAKFDSSRVTVTPYKIGYYRDKAISFCTKWKTIKGAQNAIQKFNSSSPRISINGGRDAWNRVEYVPVICDITDQWNIIIKKKIDDEISSHNKKLKLLNSKLCK